MKLQFRGWRREVTVHPHSVFPVVYNAAADTYASGEADNPIAWSPASQEFGKVNDLALSGSFLVEFTFEQEELRNWLRQFVTSKPEAAIRLLSEMQGAASIALMRKTEERAT